MERLYLRQLDNRLKHAQVPDVPVTGWIEAIRRALRMSQSQLAARLGMTQQNVARLEEAEAQGMITLQRLQAMAEALDCQLRYVVFPNAGSLDALLHTQARRTAERLVERVERTMALEDQAQDAAAREAQVEEFADELYRTLSPHIWSVPEPAVSAKKRRTARPVSKRPAKTRTDGTDGTDGMAGTPTPSVRHGR